MGQSWRILEASFFQFNEFCQANSFSNLGSIGHGNISNFANVFYAMTFEVFGVFYSKQMNRQSYLSILCMVIAIFKNCS